MRCKGSGVVVKGLRGARQALAALKKEKMPPFSMAAPVLVDLIDLGGTVRVQGAGCMVQGAGCRL